LLLDFIVVTEVGVRAESSVHVEDAIARSLITDASAASREESTELVEDVVMEDVVMEDVVMEDVVMEAFVVEAFVVEDIVVEDICISLS